MLDFCTINAQSLDGGVWCRCFSEILFDSEDNISAIIFDTPIDFNVEQVFMKYGLPDSVYLVDYAGLHGKPKINAFFYYDQYRMSLSPMEQDGTAYNVSAKTKIIGIR